MTPLHERPQSPLADNVQGALGILATGRPEDVPALADRLLAEAHAARASDVHLNSRRDDILVRFRVDGDLLSVATLPASVRDLLHQRLKVMAKLVVYQRREPQDGRIETELNGRRVSLRASFLPSLHGEQVVIRMPDPTRGRLALSQIGLSSAVLERVERLLEAPQGGLLLTGPASSGKTTTIYAALRHIVEGRGDQATTITIEDPIEAEIEGTTQTQIDPGAGVDFPRALRAALRQDPNVLVVGEIRDLETASTAIQAALSGHLLIATVHAGTAAGVFTRLALLGVERYLLAFAIIGVLNQRLVRTVCSGCARPMPLADDVRRRLKIEDLNPLTAAVGAGCPECHGTGTRGRLGVFELLEMSDEVRRAIVTATVQTMVGGIAETGGQLTLASDVRAKLLAGVIAPSEALRVLGE